MEIKRHELLREIQAHVVVLCKSHHLSDELCEKIGESVIDFLTENFAGQVISFPKDLRYTIAQRDLEIYRRFTGDNWVELTQAYHLTESALRKIIKRVQKRLV